MGYWKSKVLPKLKKVFEKNGGKKTAAAEACKSFDDTKEDINKEFEEKKTDLQPKVIEIYEASSEEIKALIKEPKEAGVKKHSASVTKFLEELSKIEFPGSKHVSEASSKYGPALVPGPVLFVFEKVSTFIVVEEKKEEPTAEPAKEEPSGVKEEIVIHEEKKVEEVVAIVEAEKSEPPPPPPPAEPVKEEEPPKA
ncbi:hypothetical protein SAY87_014643 [Trapa incisa]|uniref:Plasma membrane-associated cation-binding protein 1 n=1 Tax=Trapa incisa TaxID=236973 RepID=A0AAN7JKL6_9MYRT|nr:hypothetical protein SAY87_014643 [Trapa incisa]